MDFNGKYKKQFNYIASHYQFRFNVVTSFYEYRTFEFVKGRKTKINTPWKKYDDRIKNLILIKLMEMDLDIPQDKFNIFIESEIFSKDYNPFVEYFENLEPWNEKIDYINQLSLTVKVNEQQHFRNTLQRFLVGSLDCLLEEDAVNDVCLVFQSGQGIGKTRWMRSLLPKKFQAEYLYEGNIDTKNKDHTMYLSQYWFIHLDELETLKSNDISAIKSYITRQRISVRKAFGRYKTNFVRRASFLGSVNDDKFLTDITGNRRWLVFKTHKIDYEHNVNIDGLWSQIFYLWKKGFKHWFDIDEIKLINTINEKFRQMSLEEELLLQCVSFGTIEEGLGEFLTSADILVKIGEARPQLLNKLNAKIMGRALSKHSKTKKVKNGVTKFYLTVTGLDIEYDRQIEQSEEDSSVLNNEKYLKEKEINEREKREKAVENQLDSKNNNDDNDVPF